jgi:hypothetical protein
MEKLNLDKNNLRKFGIIMAAAFLLITIFILVRHKHSILPTVIISLAFLVLANIAPILLKPIYIFWMRLAFILSWINTHIVLLIIFYLIFTPIGLGMKLFGIDSLDRKIEKDKKSYWKKKISNKFNPTDYERQF